MHTGALETTFTSQKLSETYGTHIDVIQVDGLPVVRSLEKLQ